MPTYEYRCENCGHMFEAFQTMSEPPVEKCPVCNGKVKRIISGGAGLIFKGSGFYITDYRSSEYKAAAEKERAEKSEASSTGSSSDKSSKASPSNSPTTSKKSATKNA
ncbi:MAG: zinc ribbon domain-containing protein [Candidatus Zixiibacteriota bacterium]|nr:MAG: zinc ribbon domain-containing protein [candidate division Zixibacteria bacterium]